MITKEDLERKFTLKNKIVVTSPKGISTELKREKDYSYVIKKDESEIKLNDLKDLTEYCKDMCLYRNNEKSLRTYWKMSLSYEIRSFFIRPTRHL